MKRKVYVSPSRNWGWDNDGDPVLLDTVEWFVCRRRQDGEHVVKVCSSFEEAEQAAELINQQEALK